MPDRRSVSYAVALIAGVLLWDASTSWSQERAAEANVPEMTGAEGAPLYHTFSIVALDPATGETGVAVTTRVACVGNAVPWVRAGVGAVATQSYTRMEYGAELLDLIEAGTPPAAALEQALVADSGAALRQLGVISSDGATAQHTGSENFNWAGHRSGANFATQGNLLEGPRVVDAVAAAFEASEGSPRHLADRLIDALAAGQAAGGDARKGRFQSAAVIVADPRAGRGQRPDKVTVNINVCEHPSPVEELRRIYATVSGTLGFRELKQYAGSDVWQLKLILHALGHYRSGEEDLERGEDWAVYTPETVAAVDAFRQEQGMSTPEVGSPPGLVDAETVEALWATLEDRGLAEELRRRLLRFTQIRR